MYLQTYGLAQRDEIEQVLFTFTDYLATTPYMTIVWINKINCYAWIDFDPIQDKSGKLKAKNISDLTIIEDGAGLCEKIFFEIAQDVVSFENKSHSIDEADEEERKEIRNRIKGYLIQLPQYAYLLKNLGL